MKELLVLTASYTFTCISEIFKSRVRHCVIVFHTPMLALFLQAFCVIVDVIELASKQHKNTLLKTVTVCVCVSLLWLFYAIVSPFIMQMLAHCVNVASIVCVIDQVDGFLWIERQIVEFGGFQRVPVRLVVVGSE